MPGNEPQDQDLREFVATAEAAGRRLDVFLAEQMPDWSRSQLQQVIRSGLVKIGVRPEKFHVLAPVEEAEPGWNMIEAKAGVSVYLGVSRQYMMESKTGRPLSVYAQNSGRSEDLAHGETVRLAWNPAHTFAVKAN